MPVAAMMSAVQIKFNVESNTFPFPKQGRRQMYSTLLSVQNTVAGRKDSECSQRDDKTSMKAEPCVEIQQAER
jgi:hypothetical protein